MKRVIPNNFNSGSSGNNYSSSIFVYDTIDEALDNYRYFDENDLIYIIQNDTLYLWKNEQLNEILRINNKSFILTPDDFTIDENDENLGRYYFFIINDKFILNNITITILEEINNETYFELGTENYPGLFWTSLYDKIKLNNINKPYEILINKQNIENDVGYLILKAYNFNEGKILISFIDNKLIN